MASADCEYTIIFSELLLLQFPPARDSQKAPAVDGSLEKLHQLVGRRFCLDSSAHDNDEVGEETNINRKVRKEVKDGKVKPFVHSCESLKKWRSANSVRLFQEK